MVKESREKKILPDSEEKARSVQGPSVIGLVVCSFTEALPEAGFPGNGLHGRLRSLGKDAKASLARMGTEALEHLPSRDLLSMDNDYISNGQC